MNNDKKNQSLKYILIGLFTGLLIKYIPSFSIIDKEIIIISCCISIFYAILDKLLPSISLDKSSELKL
jgi:uncharacterized protein YacL